MTWPLPTCPTSSSATLSFTPSAATCLAFFSSLIVSRDFVQRHSLMQLLFIVGCSLTVPLPVCDWWVAYSFLKSQLRMSPPEMSFLTLPSKFRHLSFCLRALCSFFFLYQERKGCFGAITGRIIVDSYKHASMSLLKHPNSWPSVTVIKQLESKQIAIHLIWFFRYVHLLPKDKN